MCMGAAIGARAGKLAAGYCYGQRTCTHRQVHGGRGEVISCVANTTYVYPETQSFSATNVPNISSAASPHTDARAMKHTILQQRLFTATPEPRAKETSPFVAVVRATTLPLDGVLVTLCHCVAMQPPDDASLALLRTEADQTSGGATLA